jgi:hypothetical protein
MSASSTMVHFGLGNDQSIKELVVTWPGGKTQVLAQPAINKKIILNEKDAVIQTDKSWPFINQTSPILKDVTHAMALPYSHIEDEFNDFNEQILMPHKVSTQGPKIAVGDVNKDGLEDFYLCGAKNQSGKLFIQNQAGKFESGDNTAFQSDVLSEDVDAVFFDADGDKDKDLYVVSGGNEFFEGAATLLDRLYINDGRGRFTKSAQSLPKLATNKSVAIPNDVDHDGDEDLFVGGRCITNRYGAPAPSFLLVNDGKGKFDVSVANKSLGLDSLGLVTDAIWSDIDHDGWHDLIVVGEWMPVTIFKNNKGTLANISQQAGLKNTSGMWNTIYEADVNHDGWEDLLLGNLGENSKLSASDKFPLKMHVGDLTGNGFFDQILSISKNGNYFTFLNKEEMEKRFPAILKKNYTDYASFAGKNTEEIFGKYLNRTKELTIQQLSSIVLINEKNGSFKISKLPYSAQWSPIYSFISGDFDRDKRTDILCAGNFHGVSPYEGYYDSSYGLILKSQENSTFTALMPWQSGLNISGEVRDIKYIKLKNGKTLMAIAINNKPIKFYEIPM